MSATARVTVTFQMEVACSQPWGSGCLIGQLEKQSGDEVRRQIGRVVAAAAEVRVRLRCTDISAPTIILRDPVALTPPSA